MAGVSKAKSLPARDYLLMRFEYNQETGVLIWKPKTKQMEPSERYLKIWNTRFANNEAGNIKIINGKSYRKLTLDGQWFSVHRIIWKIIYDTEPNEIDHEDGNGLNNRKLNLRESYHQLNSKNVRKCSINTSGTTGVTKHKQTGRWQAKIGVDGQHIHLGLFDEIEDAIIVRKEAEVKYGFYSTHGSERPL